MCERIVLIVDVFLNWVFFFLSTAQCVLLPAPMRDAMLTWLRLVQNIVVVDVVVSHEQAKIFVRSVKSRNETDKVRKLTTSGP